MRGLGATQDICIPKASQAVEVENCPSLESVRLLADYEVHEDWHFEVQRIERVPTITVIFRASRL